VINVRQAMAATWRQPVPDHLWDYLVEKGYVGEVEEDRMPIGDLIEEAQQIRAAARSASSDDNEIARQAGGAAASARIDALSAIYAAGPGRTWRSRGSGRTRCSHPGCWPLTR